ncbi:hypothetical protein MMC13_003568 [Lambiella insularis]|nr:hypothetical protein [Lambiella insularis]
MAQAVEEHTFGSPEGMLANNASSGALPDELPPKLKGRCRLLQGLQRMSSSPSLAKTTRAPSSTYRGGGKGSLSCVSLSAATPSYGHSHDSSYDSQLSAEFSTAPTSVASTPGVDMRLFRPKNEIRIIKDNATRSRALTPISVPLPAELRYGSMGATLASAPQIDQAFDDYFSIPVVKAKPRPRRENFDFWGEMPDEIKVQIFKYLQPKEIVRCSSVAKAWHKMCFDGQLWTSLDTSGFYSDINSESLVKIMTAAGPFVKDLNLRGCVQMKDRWVKDSQKITDACRNLKYLSVQDCRMDRSSVHCFLLRNPRLVHINLSRLSTLNSSAMRIIAQSCPQLEHLNISWCKNINTDGLLIIVQSCPKLKELWAGEIEGFGKHEFLLELFERNTLERLFVSHCSDLDDDGLQILMQGKNPEIDMLTGRALVPPRKYRHLSFDRCTALTDKSVKALAYNVPKLEGLQMDHCTKLTDEALTGILESTPYLTHLNIEELDKVTNLTLQNIAKAPCASRLEHLSISYCENLGDIGMLPVVRNCLKLKSLIMDNTRISDLVLTEAAAQVRSRNRKCSVGNASGRPEVGMKMVVYDCQNVNWTGVREVLSRNAEFYRLPHDSTAPSYPCEVIALKCFYGYQPTVEEHTKRVLRGELARASMLERKWAEYMVATEEAGAQGGGHRRRRRRAREAAMVHADEEEGAMVLAHSLRDKGTKKQLAALVTLDTVQGTTVDELKKLYDHIIPVDRMINKSPANLYLMDRADLASTFTKIALWKQTQFRRIVYLDADIVALRAPDELFARDSSFAAVSDIGWPDCFNSGVLALRPNMGDYYALLALAQRGISFDGADQGLLNMYFQEWDRLSFTYNCTPSANYQYIPAYRHFQSMISLVHYIGHEKPWKMGRDVKGASGTYDELLGRWWAVYDRHFRSPTSAYISGQTARSSRIVQQYVMGEAYPANHGFSSTNPSPQHYETTSASVPVSEQPLTENTEMVEESTHLGEVTPIPTAEQRRFSAPSADWDPIREAPPTNSRPEAAHLPNEQYAMSADRTLFHAPKSYPAPPKNMWYEVPKEHPANERPKPIFPWEENQAKPSRVFADDAPKSPEPTLLAATDEETQDENESPPTPATQVTSPDPFATYSRSNAWDEMPEIERYIATLAQNRRPKVQVLQTDPTAGEDALSPTGEEGSAQRRPSMRLTDFPTEFERPSLPVTPAPVRRPSFWGEERDAAGDLPGAEGVPKQEDWDPMAKLAELQRRQSEVLAQGPTSPAQDIPNRMQIKSAVLLPTSEETDVPLTSITTVSNQSHPTAAASTLSF